MVSSGEINPDGRVPDASAATHLKCCMNFDDNAFDINVLKEIINTVLEEAFSTVQISCEFSASVSEQNIKARTAELRELVYKCSENTNSSSLSFETNTSEQDKILSLIAERAENCGEPITVQDISDRLSADALPPDFILYFGGERAYGEGNCWSGAYSEFHFSGGDLQDIDLSELKAALEGFAKRERRFGGI